MVSKDDWRITNQEKYLKGVTLFLETFSPKKTDHEHCEFCWQKIMENDSPDIEKEAYCTKDEDHWICKTCFNDFKVIFGWKV